MGVRDIQTLSVTDNLEGMSGLPLRADHRERLSRQTVPGC